MKQSSLLARSATAAIAAALALGSTQLVAQSADPAGTVVVPTVTVPPAPVDTVSVPAPAASPAPIQVSRPVVQQVVPRQPVTTPAAEPSAPVTTRQVAARPAPKPAAVRPAATAAPIAAAAPAVSNDITSPSEAAAALPPAPVASAPMPAEEAQPAPGNGSNPLLTNLIALGALLVLVLGIFAVLYRRLTRRDRNARAATAARENRLENRAPRPAVQPVITMPPAAEPVAPLAMPVAEPTAAVPIMAEPRVSYEPTPIRRNVRPATPGALPSAGAAVDLPAQMPEDYDERSALVRRMVEARPDKANPFRHRKARLKRARLILQSLGRKFEHTDPWIDLSQYPNNWPELARRYSRAA